MPKTYIDSYRRFDGTLACDRQKDRQRDKHKAIANTALAEYR